MRLALDLRFWRSGTGGIGRYSRNLLTELLKLDNETEYTAVITPADEPEFHLSAANLKKIVVDIPHFSLSEQRRLPKLLAAEHFDLIHFANFNHPIRYPGKFVVTIHDIIMHLFPTGSQKQSLLRRLAYRKVFKDCRRASQIIVPSQSTKTDLVTRLRFPEEKIVVTPEGSESQFAPQPVAKVAELKKRLGLPERYLLFVSRWERYKGLPALLEAFAALTPDFPDLGLVICGRPNSQNPDITQLVRSAQAKNPRVITPGFVTDEDLVTLYSGAAAYVHPSWYEGFGIMILEAFAAGAPVVTSNVSSLPEVVGDAGLLVDPYQTSELSSAIKRLLSDQKLADELRQKGFERVKKYSWQKMAEQTLSVYREVLNQ